MIPPGNSSCPSDSASSVKALFLLSHGTCFTMWDDRLFNPSYDNGMSIFVLPADRTNALGNVDTLTASISVQDIDFGLLNCTAILMPVSET